MVTIINLNIVENETILKTMRYMAWSRAKGELKSMLDTYWTGGSEKFTELKNTIDKFVEDIEDNAKQE